MPSKIPEHVPPPLFATWKPNDTVSMEKALATASKGYKGIYQAKGSASTYRNIDTPNISVRDGFTRADYDYFRPGERIPTDVKGIQSACAMAYRQFGIVRNMIDMMTDFITKGINIVHTSPKIQEFGREWWKKAKAKSVSNKIVKRLLREASAPVHRKIKKIDDVTLRDLSGISIASIVEKSPLKPGEIPLGYKVLNPVNIEVLGGELAQFVNEDLVQYAIRVPATLIKQIANPRNAWEKQIIKSLKPDILSKAIKGEDLIPIDQNRLVMMHYKKDDDELFPTPLLYSILDDLQMLQKLKMADRSALDGAISHIRLWKMGNLENRIIPTPEGIQTLADILLHSVGGGCVDLVWGPDLELIETSTDQFQFLGPEKYQSTMAGIYQGLGVPPSLTGTMSETGMTNNFVSLRVLVERLEYCRELLIEFWLGELEILRDVFKIKQPFQITFAMPSLSDDSAEKKLLIDLIDRDIVSAEFVQERYGADSEIEEARMQQQTRKRESKELPAKAGPFHLDSQQDAHLQRIYATSGEAAPSEVGLNLDPLKPGEEKPIDKQANLQKDLAKSKADIQAKKAKKNNGRPKGAKDTSKRKTGKQSPKQNSKASFAQAAIWARAAHAKIDELLKDKILKLKAKSNMRQLTDEESDAYENLKYSILCSHEIGDSVNEGTIKYGMENISIPQPLKELYEATIAKFIEENDTKPTLDQIRHFKELAYAMYSFVDDEDGVNIN